MPLSLQRPGLLRGANLIAGRWIDATADGIAVTNPATGEVLAHVPRFGRAEAAEAIAAAADAMPEWAALTAKARAQVLRRWCWVSQWLQPRLLRKPHRLLKRIRRAMKSSLPAP